MTRRKKGHHDLWNNDIVSEYQKIYQDEADNSEDLRVQLWEQATNAVNTKLEKEATKYENKFIDGMIYLVGTMVNGSDYVPASRPLKTGNLGEAIKKAINAFPGQNKNQFKLYIDEDELVLTCKSIAQEIPSVFSFRCLEDGVTFSGSDDLVEKSTSLAPLVKRVHGWV